MKADDLTGQRFGSWTVLRRAPGRPTTRAAHWICRCDCGTEGVVMAGNLKSGRSTRCRACGYRLGRKTSLRLAPGTVFGRWTVLGEVLERPYSGSVMWLCACACGQRRAIAGSDLTHGRTTKCAACSREEARRMGGYAWLAHLPPGAVDEFVEELVEAVRGEGDLKPVIASWKATAEAHANSGLHAKPTTEED